MRFIPSVWLSMTTRKSVGWIYFSLRTKYNFRTLRWNDVDSWIMFWVFNIQLNCFISIMDFCWNLLFPKYDDMSMRWWWWWWYENCDDLDDLDDHDNNEDDDDDDMKIVMMMMMMIIMKIMKIMMIWKLWCL
jgi:hypothetical protein